MTRSVQMAFLALSLNLASVSMAQKINPSDYYIPAYTGPRAKPDFAGEGRQYLFYRTAITEGFRDNPLAAGHYTVITVGCGTSCSFHWIGDVRSGKILPFPVGGEDYPETEIITKPDARLMVVRWGAYGDDDCHARLYVLTNGRIKQIGPDRHKGSGCDAR